jgi:hypothetical protein
MEVVGPPGFEPESIEPKSTSLDQASRRPHSVWCNSISSASIKTLSKPNPKPLYQFFQLAQWIHLDLGKCADANPETDAILMAG